jgi:hypothetical protein
MWILPSVVRSRGQITRFGLQPLADVTGAPLAISRPSRREAIVSDVGPRESQPAIAKQTTASRRGDAGAALLYRRPHFH